jgi:hypothetical protein
MCGPIARTLIVGVAAFAWAATASVAFGQGGGMGGGGRGGAGAHGSADHRSSPSDYYHGAAPPLPHATLTLHGGQYLTTESNQYELVFMPLQMRIYAYDKLLKPESARDLHVQMSLQMPGDSKVRRIAFQYFAMPPAAAQQDYIVAVFDVSELKDKETPITIEFADLPDHHHPTASFTPVFTRDRIRPYVARILATKADTDAVMRQRVCPVSGDALGSRGPIVKLLIGEYPLYVCCEDCIAAVRESPEKFLPTAAR